MKSGTFEESPQLSATALLGSVYQTVPRHLVKFTSNDNLFKLVEETRAEVSSSVLVDSYDETAIHYGLIDSTNRAIFVIRVNQARVSSLDCEQFYPKPLLDLHRPVLCSASRFARSKSFPANPALAKEFLIAVRKDQQLDGIIGDLINANTPMVPYYEKLGYRVVEGYDFIHPRLGTSSKTMLLVATGQSLLW